MVSFLAFLSVNFVIVTVGFFFEDEVTFTLSFLDATVRVVPFFAGVAVFVLFFFGSFDGFSVSDTNLTGILCSVAYWYAAESLLQMMVTFGEFSKIANNSPSSSYSSNSVTLSGIAT